MICSDLYRKLKQELNYSLYEIFYGMTQHQLTMIMARKRDKTQKIKGIVFMFLLISTNLLKAQFACNNSVQISLDEDCQVEVLPDMVLEGNHPDYSIFQVNIEGLANNVVTAPGTYNVTVTEPTSQNTCWSVITVSNKLDPHLYCLPIEIPCTSNKKPGSIVEKTFSKKGAVYKNEEDTTFIKFDMAQQIGLGSPVKNVVLDLFVHHRDISELEAFLRSPDGTMIPLFHHPQAGNVVEECLKHSMMIRFDDLAPNTHQSIDDPIHCRGMAEPSLMGDYQPYHGFDAFEDKEARGIWELLLVDKTNNDYYPSLKHATIRLTIEDGYVGLPFNDLGVTVEELGPRRIRVYGGDVCGIWIAEYADHWQEGCTADGSSYGYFDRSWIVEDASGNVSTCIQPVYLRATKLEDIEFPPNFDDIDYPSFNCFDEFYGHTESDGSPSPSLTGYPFDGRYSDKSLCDNIQLTFKDSRIDICENSYKLLRQWTVINWCQDSPHNVIDSIQVITVKDDVPPIFYCPETLKYEVPLNNTHECTLDYIVPEPDVHFECSNYTWTVTYKFSEDYEDCHIIPDGVFSASNVVHANGQVIIRDLPTGCVWIKYIVTDACGNHNEKICEIKVIDKTPPVVVCDEHTVVSLGSDGSASIAAKSFDDLSWDNCGYELKFQARKLDGFCHIDSLPTDYITFCCTEVGQSIMVELTVTDHYGNSNICMIHAQVQDEYNGYVACPDSVTVSCQTVIHELTDALYGKPEFVDNCGDLILQEATFDKHINQCGIGTINKIWKITSATDESIIIDSCIQVFTFINENPFLGEHIEFPENIEIVECGTDYSLTSTTGAPVIWRNGAPIENGEVIHSDSVVYTPITCDLIAVTYDDTRFFGVEDACEKIIREWTVIDWCQYQPEFNIRDGLWTETQIIKLNNNIAPEFLDDYKCKEIFDCSYDAECRGVISLSLEAVDDCTPTEDLHWEYALDLYNDGIIDERTDDILHDVDGRPTVSFENLALNVAHRITWIVSDGCLNRNSCSYLFTVKDCKPPTPLCLSEIVSSVMNESGEVTIWAKDFDVKSEDNCTDEDDLIFSFSEDPTHTNQTFTCDDIENGESIQNIRIWITDEAGNQDFCSVTLDVQDNLAVCNDIGSEGSLATVDGFIKTESSKIPQNVELRISSNAAGFPRSTILDDNGTFSFKNLPMGNHYEIESIKNDNPLNGVSTLDLVLIQQHILGTQELTSPYKIIAADVDNNQKVSVSDIIKLRRMILGVDAKFTNGQKSWRFVDQQFVFNNTLEPFPFTEKIILAGVHQDLDNINFTAVKIGDINDNVNINSEVLENRSNESVSFYIEDKALTSDEYVEIPVYAKDQIKILGFQNTWNYNVEHLEFAHINSGLLDLGTAHINQDNTAKGQLAMSWNSTLNAKSIEPSNPVLFTLVFKVKNEGQLSRLLTITSAVLNAELYTEALEVKELDLVFDYEMQEFAIVQNQPNPFTDQTLIGIHSAEDLQLNYVIYDSNGSKVYERSLGLREGYHEEVITAEMLQHRTGIFHVQLQSKFGIENMKILRIE